jgi:hypothetical protein
MHIKLSGQNADFLNANPGGKHSNHWLSQG